MDCAHRPRSGQGLKNENLNCFPGMHAHMRTGRRAALYPNARITVGSACACPRNRFPSPQGRHMKRIIKILQQPIREKDVAMSLETVNG